MNANNETIRRLADATLRKFAESPANGLCPDDCSFGALVDEFRDCIAAVWPQVFGETVPEPIPQTVAEELAALSRDLRDERRKRQRDEQRAREEMNVHKRRCGGMREYMNRVTASAGDLMSAVRARNYVDRVSTQAEMLRKVIEARPKAWRDFGADEEVSSIPAEVEVRDEA